MPKPQPTAEEIERARRSLEKRLAPFGTVVKIEKMLRVGGGSRPHVAVVMVDGVECVIKDHEGCDRWFARWLGPLLSRREVRALRRLHSVDGIPRVMRVLDKRAFVMTSMNARPYRLVRADDATWARFFESMERLVAEMHELGVAHCDLRSPNNTLMTAEGAPAIVDFVASYRRGALWNPWSRWVFSKLCEVDRSAIEKQRRTIAPLADSGDLEGVAGAAPTRLDRLARGFGVFVRNLARRLFTDAARK